MDELKPLRDHIYKLVIQLPLMTVRALAKILQYTPNESWHVYFATVLRSIPQSQAREDLQEFLHFWHHSHSQVSPEVICIILLSIAETLEVNRQHEQVELVWTGYHRQQASFRSTQESLIELFEMAECELHIVSFAIYRFKPVIEALHRAIARGVKVNLYLEMLNETDETTVISLLERFDSFLASHVLLYVWDKTKRPLRDKSTASMHAKIAIADNYSLLITSANLTEYALTINLEAGIFIKGGKKPKILWQEIKTLVDSQAFIKVN